MKKLQKTKTGMTKYPSWLTTDKHEVDLRRERSKAEPMQIKTIPNEVSKYFTNYIVKRKDFPDSREYKVEIRSFCKPYNYCSCPDFGKNFLGTCKHIEKILTCNNSASIRKSNSPFIEVFIDYSDDEKLTVLYPDKVNVTADNFMRKYTDSEKIFRKPIINVLQVFMRDMENACPEIYKHIRLSDAVIELNRKNILQDSLKRLESAHKNEIRESALSGKFLKYPLYDYQVDGMLHLAFTGRTMLADEMGLGKTVQAVAAAALMKEYLGIRRVMVVCPTSLKTEWEEQIKKFTAFNTEIVFGSRKERLKIYQNTDAFFILTNYEQILRDHEDINTLLQPDLIILDEAQRIKNWKTKTSSNIKRLTSKFAFILTGTPIENRIDEIYSLTEFIDPKIFGSLFRFNRNFYSFNAEGKTEGLKNLRQLHEIIKPVMLRRRKDEIAEQLPERIDNNYFVRLTQEQQKRYDEQAYRVSILMSIAKSRPLKPEEHDELQRRLACMRMLCDTVYILDQKITDSPKVDEVIKILNDIWDNNPERKVIIFSEWVKMLELIKKQLEDNKVKFSWHVGSVPQQKRRDEINKFKNDHECRVFLSTDSGGVGLNLQVASVVINMDMPWNPAKLEQRIARAWRKHQKNSVNVINLIAEETIEHRMLATLDFKQGLAEGVLDARGDIDDLEKPNAKNKFMERLASIMKTSFTLVSEKDEATESALTEESQISKEEIFKQELEIDIPKNLELCSGIFDSNSGRIKGILAVSNDESTQKELEHITEKINLDKEKDLIVINNYTYNLLQKLSKMGVITFNDSSMKQIYKSNDNSKEQEQLWRRKREIAESIYKKAERNFKMAQVLKNSGFDNESIPPLIDSVRTAAKSLFILANNQLLDNEPSNISEDSIRLIKQSLNLNEDLTMFLILCCIKQDELAKTSIDMHNYAQLLHKETETLISKQGL